MTEPKTKQKPERREPKAKTPRKSTIPDAFQIRRLTPMQEILREAESQVTETLSLIHI